MGSTATIQDGKVVNPSASDDKKTNSNKGKGNTMGKEAFLKLLTAQMKYQDPLQPTSNTEYVAQLATFSQLEEMQNVRASSDLQRAQALLGKQVIIDNGNGDIAGKVDMVSIENGKPYLSVGDKLYSLDDVETVGDDEYLAAYETAKKFVDGVEALPSTHSMTISSKEEVKKLREAYDKMSDYEKTFIGEATLKKLEAAEERIKEIDPEYREAVNKATEFKDKIKELPALNELTLASEGAITELRTAYNKMTDLQKEVLGSSSLKDLESYEAKIKELKEAAGA